MFVDDNEKFKKSIEEEEEEGSVGRISDEKELKDKQHQTINPKIHTFRVISACDAISCCDNNNKEKNSIEDTTTTNTTATATITTTTTATERKNKTNILYCCIQKPILMCFICKLSFGNTKSFILHSNTEHQLNLPELERNLLKLETYSSAIIQRSMDEKPQVSFLQPLNLQLTNNELTQAIENQQQQQHQLQHHHEQTIIDNKKDQNEIATNLSITPLVTSIKKELEEINEQDVEGAVVEQEKQNQKLKEDEMLLTEKSREDDKIRTDEISDSKKPTTLSNVHDFNVPPPPPLPLPLSLALPATPPSSTFSAHFVDFLHDNFSTTPSTTIAPSPIPIPTTTTTITTPTTPLSLQQQNFLLNNSNNSNNNNDDIQNNLKFVNDFFETKFLLKQQQQQHQQQQQQQECDTSLSDEHDLTATATTRTTPTLSISTTTSPFNQTQQQQQQNAAVAAAAAAAASLTIGACPEHANGRPVGVDCMR